MDTPQFASPGLQYGQPASAPYPQQPQPIEHVQQHQQPAQYATEMPVPIQRSADQTLRGGGWSNSLLDCSPMGSCLLGTFLPCILLGQTADRMRDPTMATADTLNSDCLVFTAIQCITGCGWIHIMMKRSEIRERYGMDSDGMSDCCVTYWCPCCALIQQDKEVRVRTGPAPGPVTQGYQAPSGMQMPQGKH